MTYLAYNVRRFEFADRLDVLRDSPIEVTLTARVQNENIFR